MNVGETIAPPNADQVAYWNGDAGAKWATLQERLDRLFAGITEQAIAAAAPIPGERVLDIGCGCGATVLALAKGVGANGHVLGVDISDPMLDVARRRVAADGLSQAEVLLADAATHRFAAGQADLIFSRFGVMFFDAPVEAFINLRQALAPEGRLFFACWRPFKHNDWFAVPFKAVVPHLPPQEKPEPDAPGPFAFADPDRVTRILGLAGFTHVAIRPVDTMLTLGRSDDMAGTAGFASQVGPVSRALATAADDSQREAAERALTEVLRGHDGPEGIRLGAELWFVSAEA